MATVVANVAGPPQVPSGSTIDSPTFTGNIQGAGKRLASWAIPFIHLSSGTMGNNGALSAITALAAIYSGGAWCLFPAGAIASGVPAAAAWYWVTFSSTTAGTVWNSTYTSGVPTVGTQTAFVTTGPGAFTGSTTTTDGPTIPIPGGSMGANGQIVTVTDFNFTNNANNKPAMVKIGGTAFLNQTFTSDVNLSETTTFENKGATNVNRGGALGASLNTGTVRATAPTWTSIDTTASMSLVVSLGKAVATDNVVLERVLSEVFYAP